MGINDSLSVVAIVLSAISFLLSFWLNLRSAKSDIRPVLVFIYSGQGGWYIRNIGSGPALNVTIGQKDMWMKSWSKPVRIPPIEKEGTFHLKWLANLNIASLGVVYEDFHGRVYSSTCENDLSRISGGRGSLPNWKESDIERHWQRLS